MKGIGQGQLALSTVSSLLTEIESVFVDIYILGVPGLKSQAFRFADRDNDARWLDVVVEEISWKKATFRTVRPRTYEMMMVKGLHLFFSRLRPGFFGF
jgi:hypothetical protein